ncbi:hypothetical protein VNO77_19702 [Canavalia gladiata]|uniref:Uncharacterized protein n=1 Tax=Canavalia gladiata TaxID=3824 RepID=A0AAN9LN71_CANGL
MLGSTLSFLQDFSLFFSATSGVLCLLTALDNVDYNCAWGYFGWNKFLEGAYELISPMRTFLPVLEYSMGRPECTEWKDEQRPSISALPNQAESSIGWHHYEATRSHAARQRNGWCGQESEFIRFKQIKCGLGGVTKVNYPPRIFEESNTHWTLLAVS